MNGASAHVAADEDDESDTFVYPVPNEEAEQPKEAVADPAPARVNGDGCSPSEIDVDAIVAEREAKLKQYYEAQVDQLTDKVRKKETTSFTSASLTLSFLSFAVTIGRQ